MGPKTLLVGSLDPQGKAEMTSIAYRSLSSMSLFEGDLVWGFPKIGDTSLGVLLIRTTVFWGLYWGPLILGNCHFLV